MPIPITMPALSPTMTEGNLTKWLKAEGDTIKPGDVIAEIETDKATMEVEAVDEGTLGKILVAEGSESVAVNTVIAVLLAEGEDKKALASYAAGPKTASAAPAKAPAPAAPRPTAQSAPPAVARPTASAAPPVAPASDGRVIASPLAKRMAAQAGVDIGALKGSGPHGRIVKADIDAAVGKGGAPAMSSAARGPAPAAQPSAGATRIPHTNMRKVIARRLTEAKQTIPHIYLTIDCEIDELLKLRKQLNAKAEAAKADYKLSVNDFVIRAAALALRKVPGANVSWTDDAVLQHNAVDISIAVAVPGGLITPIVKNADQKGLAAISREMKDLAARAKDGKLKPEEFQGGTFSISNLGMYGIRQFEAVINPPQAAILAVGAGEERAVVKQGALAIATVMSVTLSSDHRVVDGALAAEWLQAFKGYVSDPLTMLL